MGRKIIDMLQRMIKQIRETPGYWAIILVAIIVMILINHLIDQLYLFTH